MPSTKRLLSNTHRHGREPPYNTGDRDWQYNNRYIDEKDRWRHSKWL